MRYCTFGTVALSIYCLSHMCSYSDYFYPIIRENIVFFYFIEAESFDSV